MPIVSRTTPRAFTLIEMLVVIAIILTLLGILIGAVGQFSSVASQTAAQQMMAAVEMGLKSYNTDFGAYPPSTGTVAGYGNNGGHILAGVMFGPGPAGTDGRTGFGIASGGRNYGPYLDAKHESSLQGSGSAWWISMADSPGKVAVLYYKFVGTGGTGPTIGGAGQVWGSGTSRFVVSHNSALDTQDPTTYYQSPGSAGKASVSERNSLANSLRAAKYLLVYAGPDDKHGTEDDIILTGK